MKRGGDGAKNGGTADHSRGGERRGVRGRLGKYVTRLSQAIGLRRTGAAKAAADRRTVPGAERPAETAGKGVRAAAAKPRTALAELVPVETPVCPEALHIVPPPSPVAFFVGVERGPQVPCGYGEDRIEALVRDPRCIFVYWELGGCGCRLASDRYGAAAVAAGRWVLRMEHQTGPDYAAGCFDVPVDPVAGNWYLPVEPGTRYRVRIGVVLPSGEFVELAASGIVITPPEWASDRLDEHWMMTREEFERLMACMEWSGPAGSSGVFRRRSVEVLRGLQLSSSAVGGRR